jgi:hypothetical protein
MNRAARLRIALIILAVLVVAGIFLMPRLTDWRFRQAFTRIRQGDEEKLVALYLGSPERTGGCGTQLRWNEDSLGANDGRCVKEARFDGRGGTWVVGYSANGHVIAKYFEAAN